MSSHYFSLTYMLPAHEPTGPNQTSQARLVLCHRLSLRHSLSSLLPFSHSSLPCLSSARLHASAFRLKQKQKQWCVVEAAEEGRALWATSSALTRHRRSPQPGRLLPSVNQLLSSSERRGLRGTLPPRRSLLQQQQPRLLTRQTTPEPHWTWAPPRWAETLTTITVPMDRTTATSLLIGLQLRFMPLRVEDHLWVIFSVEIKRDTCKCNQRCLNGLVEYMLQQFTIFNARGVRRLACRLDNRVRSAKQGGVSFEVHFQFLVCNKLLVLV